MTQVTLTEKEIATLLAIGDNALQGMGGDDYSHLYDDNYSWFQPQDIVSRTNFSKAQVAGLISALEAKDLILESDGDWCLTERGIAQLECLSIQA